MGLDLSPHPKPSPQLTISPENLQSLAVLQLSKPELIQMINQELEINPALEIYVNLDPEKQTSSSNECKEDDPTDLCSELDLFYSELNLSEEDGRPPETGEPLIPETDPPLSDTRPDSLSLSLLKQLRMARLTPDELRTGVVIADSLDENGFLNRSIEEIAAFSGCPTGIELVLRVLAHMQSFDPPGVCARDLKECLLIQARQLKYNDPVLEGIIEHHLDNLKRKDFKSIAKALKTSLAEVASAAGKISRLEPRPARRHSETSGQHIDPDLMVHKFEDQWKITLNHDGIPKLMINPLYIACEKNGDHLSGNDRKFIRIKKRAAKFLIGCITKRQHTLLQVMESILKFQSDFFEKGSSALKPLQMKAVADDLKLSEQTVARSTRNKYVRTSFGIFSLRYFFNGAIEQTEGQPVSVSVVQGLIQKAISEENKAKPLSDAKIEERLKAAGFDVQRRTIAKYREKMGILPASQRKRI
jgi:RNA polymerase sigma-54 factor